MKQANIPDAGYEEHQSFSNDMGQNPENMLVPDVPCLICLKKWFADHVSEDFCKSLGWVYQCEDFTFHFTSSFVQM